MKNRKNTKLTDSNIEYIRDELFKKNKTQKELALYLNVKPAVISAIFRRKSYKNIP